MLIIKRAYTKHVGEGDGGFYKLFKKKKKNRVYRAKYFIAQ